MRLAAISYCFHKLFEDGRMNVFGYLETCRYRLGLQTADIWDGMLASTEEGYLRKVKEALEERELTLVNVAIDEGILWLDDPEARARGYQKALDYVRASEFLGAKTVRLDAGGPEKDLEWTDEQFEWIVKGYRKLAQRAYDGGYRLGPENHWGAAATPPSLKRLCQAVDSPGLGVLLHFNRWHGPEAERGDDLLAPWAMHTHLTKAIPDAALYEKMTALRDSGYNGYWSVEYVSTRYSEIELQLAKVRDVLERWRVDV